MCFLWEPLLLQLEDEAVRDQHVKFHPSNCSNENVNSVLGCSQNIPQPPSLCRPCSPHLAMLQLHRRLHRLCMASVIVCDQTFQYGSHKSSQSHFQTRSAFHSLAQHRAWQCIQHWAIQAQQQIDFQKQFRSELVIWPTAAQDPKGRTSIRELHLRWIFS